MRFILQILIIIFFFSCQEQIPTVSGTVISNKEAYKIRELFPSPYTPSILINHSKRVLKTENYSDEKIPLNSNIDSINNIIKIIGWDKLDSISTEIEISGQRIGMLNDICVELTASQLIVAWISRPFYSSKGNRHPKSRYSLWLKCIDKSSGNILFNQEIHSTKFGIDRLSISHNKMTNSVLLAYNDFSKSDIEYLMYGSINIDKETEAQLKPKQVILQDKSEKRFPKFLKGSEAVYLYHTSNDNWSHKGYVGKKSIGISKIDKNDELINYRVIRDQYPINENLILVNDIIYYRLENSRKYGEMLIKRIKLSELFKK